MAMGRQCNWGLHITTELLNAFFPKQMWWPNIWTGYEFKNLKNEAIDIFKYNLAANPNSADAYEGLAEGYDDMGKKEWAIKSFKKSVELNPKNRHAADRIKKLEGENKQ